jgi:hypothetical protein
VEPGTLTRESRPSAVHACFVLRFPHADWWPSKWAKPADFVHRMVSEDKLPVTDRGPVTNEALREFYAAHGTELD